MTTIGDSDTIGSCGVGAAQLADGAYTSWAPGSLAPEAVSSPASAVLSDEWPAGSGCRLRMPKVSTRDTGPVRRATLRPCPAWRHAHWPVRSRCEPTPRLPRPRDPRSGPPMSLSALPRLGAPSASGRGTATTPARRARQGRSASAQKQRQPVSVRACGSHFSSVARLCFTRSSRRAAEAALWREGRWTLGAGCGSR